MKTSLLNYDILTLSLRFDLKIFGCNSDKNSSHALQGKVLKSGPAV